MWREVSNKTHVEKQSYYFLQTQNSSTPTRSQPLNPTSLFASLQLTKWGEALTMDYETHYLKF
jgi:hypothetical protein